MTNTKKQTLILVLTTLTAAALWGACGSSSSAAPAPAPTPPAPTVPTISSVTFSGGNATPSATSLSTSAITNASVDTSAFTMTFSEAMDPTTITTSSVTLTCGSATNYINSISETSATVFVASVSGELPALTACTFTITSDVQSAENVALASDSAYASLTTGCTTSDAFATDDLSTCWTLLNSNPPTKTVGISSNRLAIDIDSAVSGSPPAAYKVFGTSDRPTVTVAIPTFSGLVDQGVDPTQADDCHLEISDGADDDLAVNVRIRTDGAGNLYAQTSFNGSSHNSATVAGSSSAAFSGTLYFQLTISDSTVTAGYRVGDSGSFTSFAPWTTTFSDNYFIVLGASNVDSITPTDDVNCQFANFTVTGASATDQD